MRLKRGTSSSAVLDLCFCVWRILHMVRLILYLCSSVSLSVSHHDESHPPSFNPLIWMQPEREEQNVPLWSAICMFTFINTDMRSTDTSFQIHHVLNPLNLPGHHTIKHFRGTHTCDVDKGSSLSTVFSEYQFAVLYRVHINNDSNYRLIKMLN